MFMAASFNGGATTEARAERVSIAPVPTGDLDSPTLHATVTAPAPRQPGGSRVDLAGLPTDVHPADWVHRAPEPSREPQVAVLLPCRNEETTIAAVVADFRRALPDATVYVYDNASTDRTAAVARRAGAIVAHVPRPGKGNVLRQMFADVDADVYLMADGDGTYDAAAAPKLIATLLDRNLDMVVGRRVDGADVEETYRLGHRFGNQLFTSAVRWIFGPGPEDMLSGYRAFSRRYVRSFPATSRGFEIETEMTVHALDLCVPFSEVPTTYRARPADSTSKLRTIPDGLRILGCIVMLCKEYRPARFFGTLLAALFAGAAVAVMMRPWDAAGTVGTGQQVLTVCAVLGLGLLNAGLVLDSVSRNQRAMKRVLYLAASDRSAARRPARSV
jgi:Glycosyl transferase family 2